MVCGINLFGAQVYINLYLELKTNTICTVRGYLVEWPGTPGMSCTATCFNGQEPQVRTVPLPN